MKRFKEKGDPLDWLTKIKEKNLKRSLFILLTFKYFYIGKI